MFSENYIIKKGIIIKPNDFKVLNLYISGWSSTTSGSATFSGSPINNSATARNTQNCTNTASIYAENGYCTFSINVHSVRALHNDVLEMRFINQKLKINNYVEIVYKSSQQGRSSKVALDTFESVNWKTSVNDIPYSTNEATKQLKVLHDGYIDFVVATQHGEGTGATFNGINTISIRSIKIL